ncbi:Membrane protein [Dissulfuribacter thermophilus]|uniref:Membrane protein n=1 Tax=Dissulfuribacter thermophilus TaxID=1156395 RepID=A0A1B9F6C8_9BACT|nr:M23 family metallopeptidase [Dissulfuribacter thermophilus]OCC15365.1 Membrane protein [Dissulfuribacter thermophilus]
MKRIFYTIVFILILSVLGVIGYFGSIVLEGDSPQITINSPTKYLSKNSPIIITAKDSKAGLRSISISIVQGDNQIQLGQKVFPIDRWWEGSSVKETTVSWNVDPKALNLKEGPSTLVVVARDASFRSEFKGNAITVKKEIIIDTTPPRISVLSRVHNVRIGGSGLVTFKVNEPVKKAGVLVGNHFFKPFNREKDNTYSCLFAVPALAPKSQQGIFLIAIDMAGNEQKRGFYYDLLPFRPVKDTIRISENFLRRKMPEFSQLIGQDSKDLLSVFLKVNNDLRKQNNDRLLSFCQKVSGPPMWKNGFKALPNAAKRAGFADERHYYYRGKEIDQANHMGIDLASIKNAPVPAANSGTVVFAGDLGIYGNTVIIDHGAGLYTSYSHLGDMTVSPGEVVDKGYIIGKTDTTGLAGGDHLHFATIVQGVFVNPLEWLDARWIKDHIDKNM